MNESIHNARQAALDLLQPSPRDLDHGLALHRESLVFDAYGFAPRAAPDGDRVAGLIAAGASPDEIDDLLEDMPMTRIATDPDERREALEAWDEAGVDCIFQNAGEEHCDPRILVKRLARFTYATDLLRAVAPRAAMPDDIPRARAEGKHCLYFSANAVPLLGHWVSTADELRYIRIFFQLGIRMMHLTYNRRNPIGDGCGEPSDAGLSHFGHEVMAEMNRVGVIVDVAHAGHRTSLEAARASQRPLVASHTGAHALSGHARCKPDAVLKAIADTGGYCGVCCISPFLGGAGDISVFLDHLQHMVRIVGTDHVAIGTDLAYVSSRTPVERGKIPTRPPRRTAWRTLPPKSDGDTMQPPQPAQHPSLAWTHWPLFTVGLVQRGLSDDDIRKILGENCLRVARENWDGRHNV